MNRTIRILLLLVIANMNTTLPCQAQAQSKPKSKTPIPQSGKPKTIQSPNINKVFQVEFKQDTDAYFLITTTETVSSPDSELMTSLDSGGFVAIGKDMVHTQKLGLIWKTSKAGYEAVPGNIPVCARINFFTQQFGAGTQSVVGALVRKDGSVVSQNISNYSVVSGYETVPLPQVNIASGATFFAPFDRPVYESRTRVVNKLSAPLVPFLPFPLPSNFNKDSKFSILLTSPMDEAGIQTIFNTKKIFRDSENLFAEGELGSAVDIGPVVHGKIIINLTSGTLHQLDANIEYSGGQYVGRELGPWKYKIQARRVAASTYFESGVAEYKKNSTITSGSSEFDKKIVASRIIQNKDFALLGLSTACLFDSDKFVTKIENIDVTGTWEITKRQAVLWLPKEDFDGKYLGVSDETSMIGIACDIHLGSKELLPRSILLKTNNSISVSKEEISPFVKEKFKNVEKRKLSLKINKFLTSRYIYCPDSLEHRYFIHFLNVAIAPGKMYAQISDGVSTYEADYGIVDGIVIVEVKKGLSIPDYIKPKYIFSVEFPIKTNEKIEVIDISTFHVWPSG